MIEFIGASFLLFLTGYFVLQIICTKNPILSNFSALSLIFSFGLGLGLCSVFYFWGLVIYDGPSSSLVFFEVLLSILLFLVLYILMGIENAHQSPGGTKNIPEENNIKPIRLFHFFRKFNVFEYKLSSSRLRPLKKEKEPNNWFTKLIVFVFFTTLLLCFLVLIQSAFMQPHGSWDAWAIWNMHARFLFAAENRWVSIFTAFSGWSHPDYPLLLPAAIARFWFYLGDSLLIIPMLISLSFCIAVALLLYFSLSSICSRGQAAFVGLILFLNPALIEQGTYQFADIPISFYFLSTLLLFVFFEREEEQSYSFIVLAGFFAALSAWTKNEGILFILVIFLVRFFVSTNLRSYFREMKYFVAGLLPILATLIYFKYSLAFENDLFRDPASFFEKIFDLKRYLYVLKAFFLEYLKIGQVLSALLFLWLVFFKRSLKQLVKPEILTILFVVVLMHGAYFATYILTPTELSWHLNNSLSRLLIQLWPILLLLFALITKTPEELCSKN